MKLNASSGDFLSGRYERLFLALAFIIPLLWLGAVRFFGMPDGETANDAYYHVAIAERGPSVFCAKKFPALELSVWRDTFADKELLYHFALCGLVNVQKFLGIPVHAPFHFPAVFFLILLIASLLFVMKKTGVAPPLYLPMTMLALAVSPNVMFRMLMLRPHILSIILMLVLCGFLCSGSYRLRLTSVCILSLIYTWSYSNPQFIVIPVICFALAGLPSDGWKKSLLLPVCTLGCVLLGLLIHPQFPNSFIIWKVQSFNALFGPLLAKGAAGYRTLMPPLEMMSPGVIWNRNNLPMYAFAYLNLLIFARLVYHLGWKKIPSYCYAFGALSLMFTVGTFMVLRTIEYAGPFTGVFGAIVWSMALREKIFLPGTGKPERFGLVLTLAAFLLAGIAAAVNISYSGKITTPADKLGSWMERNLPEKELVVNLSWGDFPALYCSNRKQVFLWGMDPEFSIAADPKRTRRIESFLLRQQELTPRRFAHVTGARYAVVLAKREEFTDFLKDLGWRTVYEGEDGAVLKVD